ncbi:Lcl C-terminal domain-containing protein [Teredinibacter purpureus]|uniref:Lcl C-terminal domain-containing protein n=1 Tax=Teredinibacter purpureus TaxID=2731756 RepID=UPI0009E2F4AF|nr:DUF1566 domain-containing protein [Teredinibacter purpureus]
MVVAAGQQVIRAGHRPLQVPNTLNGTGGFAGYSDWRVPNIKKILSIIEVPCSSPSINSDRFLAASIGNYWTGQSGWAVYRQ